MKDVLLPLRRLHGKLYENRIAYLKSYRYWKSIFFPLKKKIWIVGTPEYTNLGDSAIAMAQECFLRICGFDSACIKDISRKEYYKYRDILKRCNIGKLLITAIGGGNMGDQWFLEEKLRWDLMEDFSCRDVVVFPQTIYYTPTEAGADKQKESVKLYNRADRAIVAREEKSYEILKNLYPKASILLTPDIVLSTTMADYGVTEQERISILWVMRSDEEKSMTDEMRDSIMRVVAKTNLPIVQTDMYSDCPVNKENRVECVRKKMQEFCGAKLVITDRLHGMVFAAITGTPCIVFSNYNQKVKGTYDWISYLPYIHYAETAEDAIKAIPELLKMENCKFDNEPLMPYYEKLKELIMEK